MGCYLRYNSSHSIYAMRHKVMSAAMMTALLSCAGLKGVGIIYASSLRK